MPLWALSRATGTQRPLRDARIPRHRIPSKSVHSQAGLFNKPLLFVSPVLGHTLRLPGSSPSPRFSRSAVQVNASGAHRLPGSRTHSRSISGAHRLPGSLGGCPGQCQWSSPSPRFSRRLSRSISGAHRLPGSLGVLSRSIRKARIVSPVLGHTPGQSVELVPSPRLSRRLSRSISGAHRLPGSLGGCLASMPVELTVSPVLSGAVQVNQWSSPSPRFSRVLSRSIRKAHRLPGSRTHSRSISGAHRLPGSLGGCPGQSVELTVSPVLSEAV